MMAPDEVVDAHVHVASSDEARYPRRPNGLGSEWWRDAVGVEDLLAGMDECGVDRAVVVQAVGVYGYDCSYAADVTGNRDRLAFVAAVDMTGSDPVGDLERLAETTDLVGLRLFGVGAGGVGWLADGTAASVWERAAELPCVLVPTIFPDALQLLRGVVERHPEVEVALDHSAFVDPGQPDSLAALRSMAEFPGVHLKVTSHNLDTDGDPAMFLEGLLGTFGAERLCWGSDHPQHHTRTYSQLLDMARSAARNLTPAQRSAFLGGNARRLWWPGEPSGNPRAAAGGHDEAADERTGSADAC